MSTSSYSVLFCTARADWGGGPEHLLHLLRHTPAGVQAHVACPTQDRPYARRYADIVGAERCIDIPHRTFSPRALFRLVRHIRTHRINILHSHGKGAGLYIRLAGILSGTPCVHTFHGLHMDHYSIFTRTAYKICEKLLCLITAHAISVSESETRAILQEKFCSKDRLATIPNGVSIPKLPAALASKKPYTVVHISRFDSLQKNSDFFEPLLLELHTINRLKDFQFILIGDGENRTRLQQALRQQGLDEQVKFTGFCTHPAQHFEGALCYLSCSRWEGMPLSVIEAQAHGLPSIVTNVLGNIDVVQHGHTGLLYTLDDAKSAASALCSLADDTSRARHIGNAAREQACVKFSAETMAHRTYTILNNVVNSAKKMP